jgi:molybdenum cofactor cytidylyltransferase
MQPTEEKTSSKARLNPTAGIILAAGLSARFGRPKQLLKLKNKHLIEWVLDSALMSQLQNVVLVLGHKYREILRILGTRTSHPRLEVVINHRYLEGQSRSLRAGLSKVRHTHSSVMFLLADQPLLASKTIDRMLDKFWKSEKDIGVPVCRGKRGNPTIFNRIMYEQLLAIKGDTGARDIIRSNPSRVLQIEIDDPLCFFDVDSEKDFTHLQDLLA